MGFRNIQVTKDLGYTGSTTQTKQELKTKNIFEKVPCTCEVLT